jgi:ABC-type Zn2+ transport system, periplasmic component/surface adhesin
MCKENSHDHNHDHEHEHCHNHEHDGKEHAHEHSHVHAHEHEHCHDESHTHSHGDGHGHKHECKCESVANDNLSKEEKTLKLLLSHWVEHNKAHEEGFKDWVEKSKQMGRAETSDSIKKAIEFMEKADEMLLEAQKHI